MKGNPGKESHRLSFFVGRNEENRSEEEKGNDCTFPLLFQTFLVL